MIYSVEQNRKLNFTRKDKLYFEISYITIFSGFPTISRHLNTNTHQRKFVIFQVFHLTKSQT